jgi:hypothetical protein
MNMFKPKIDNIMYCDKSASLSRFGEHWIDNPKNTGSIIDRGIIFPLQLISDIKSNDICSSSVCRILYQFSYRNFRRDVICLLIGM